MMTIDMTKVNKIHEEIEKFMEKKIRQVSGPEYKELLDEIGATIDSWIECYNDENPEEGSGSV